MLLDSTTTATRPAWADAALAMLRQHQNPDGGWPYFAAGPSAIEPTATAVAALHALDLDPDARTRGLNFISSMQVAGGALKPQPSQVNPTALSAMAAIVLVRCGGNRNVAAHVADTLASWTPQTQSRNPIFGDDPMLRGFSWTPDTFSWIEPTVYSLLLFEALGRGDDPRLAECRPLIINRAIPGGGWNYGNSVVFGTVLESDPFPTAIALLGLLDDPDRPVVETGADYLRRIAPHTPSPVSLGWSRIALRALGDDTIDASRFADLLNTGTLAPTSPWHHAVALLAIAPIEKNPFVSRGAAA